MKELLVGTVAASHSPAQQEWLNLQLKFLEATTPEFDHITVVPGRLEDELPPEEELLRHEKSVVESITSHGKFHFHGLKHLLKHFKDEQANYEFFLFLDNDAFPIRKNWLGHLRESLPKNKKVSASVRAENLETRLHVSIVLADQRGIRNLKFVRMHSNTLMGTTIKIPDIHVSPYDEEKRMQAFPFMRSNKINVHPFFCAVYFDMFYHHGCGSRLSRFKSAGYWDRMREDTTIEDLNIQLRDRLFTSPGKFVGELAGWSPGEYADV
jgi:hypothetical protein